MTLHAARLQSILKAYGEKVSIYQVIKQTFAGYSISYVTPSARIGGEPLKAYMLNKDCGVSLRTATSAVIIDKFVELFGSVIIGIIGLTLLFFIPGIPYTLKATLSIVLIMSVIMLLLVYYLTIKGRGPFTSLFNALKFYKIAKWKKLTKIIKDVEGRMATFFQDHKKAFFISFSYYILYTITSFLEFKLAFLMIGINVSLLEIILATVIWGLMNFVPVPGGIGFQEASQSGLFSVLKGSASAGLAFSLIIRFGLLIVVGIGFAIIFDFGGKELIQKYKNKKNESIE